MYHFKEGDIKKKNIIYQGATITVQDDGTIIWNGKIRKHSYNNDGYPVVSIETEKGWRNPSVHRLIALAFIPNPNNHPEVDHINFDRKDYSISNLRWITHAENVRKSVVNKPDMHGENNPNYGNKKLSQFYKDHPEISKEKQGRPGKQNGRYKHGKYMSEKV